jgi:uncharacterized protein (TIGR02996 family)
MPTERDFLDAIHAAPDDATTKLVFADWLEEQGDPRSDLLRCLVDWQDESTPDPHEARQRLDALLKSDAGRRLRRFKGVGDLLPSPSGLFALEVKGIPGEAQPLPLDDWAWITDLGVGSSDLFLGVSRLVDRLAYKPRIAFRPEGGCWRALSDIFASPCWRHVSSLELRHDSLQGADLQSVLDSFTPGQLQALYLPHNSMDDEAVRFLAWSPKLTGLRILDLSNNSLGDAAVRALLDSPVGAGLERCDISWNPITLAGLEAWLGSRFASLSDYVNFDTPTWHLQAWRPHPARTGDAPLSTIRDLTLVNCPLTVSNLGSLLRLIGSGQLRRVETRGCLASLDDWRAFLAAPFLASLEEAKFTETEVSREELATVLQAPFAGRIIRLEVIDDRGMLLRFGPYDEGEWILENGQADLGEDPHPLVESPLWRGATHIEFQGSIVTDLAPLFPLLPDGLLGLILNDHHLTPEVVEALLMLPRLQRLDTLVVIGPSPQNEETLARLRQRFPFLTLRE